jgi:large subunit ribosomal protein L28
MARVCFFTGKKTHHGNSLTHRGKAKYLGGVGTKVTGKTKRKFRPNLHTLTAVVDGSVQRIKVSTKAIRMGLVIKPLKRKYAYRKPEAVAAAPEAPAAGQAPANP